MKKAVKPLTPCAAAPRQAGVLAASPCNNNELRRATRHLGQLFDDVIGASGLRAAQQGLLFQIEAMNGPTMKALAKIIVMDLSALGHTLKPLIRDGYVDLVPCDKDGRVKRVFLTDAGRAKFAEGLKLWQMAQEQLESVMGSDKALQLRETLAMISSDQFAQAFHAAAHDGGRPAGG